MGGTETLGRGAPAATQLPRGCVTNGTWQSFAHPPPGSGPSFDLDEMSVEAEAFCRPVHALDGALEVTAPRVADGSVASNAGLDASLAAGGILGGTETLGRGAPATTQQPQVEAIVTPRRPRQASVLPGVCRSTVPAEYAQYGQLAAEITAYFTTLSETDGGDAQGVQEQPQVDTINMPQLDTVTTA